MIDFKDIFKRSMAVRHITAILVFLFLVANAAYCFIGGAWPLGVLDLGCVVPWFKFAEKWCRYD